MSIKIGTKVRFLNDVGGGRVTKILDRQHVIVENETGFDVPVPLKEIVVIEEEDDYTARVTTNDNSQSVATDENDFTLDLSDIFYPEVAQIEENGDKINLFFAFVPENRPGNSNLTVFLINDSNYNVLYSIVNKDDLGNTFSNSVGVLEANTKLQTETLALQSVNQLPEYAFDFIFYKQGNFSKQKPFSKSIKINPIRFFKEKAYIENDFFEENAILIPLTQNFENEKNIEFTKKDIDKIIRDKEKPEQKHQPIPKKTKEKEMLEIDLHINELLDDCRGLSNGEIIEIQMDRFHSELKKALKNGPKNIVFIHGVGNGTLKTELRKALDLQKDKVSYHDASFKEYGYGATMVKLYKK